MSPRRAYRLGVDIGGTFTDAVLVDVAKGTAWSTKVLTTDYPADGAIAAADAVTAMAGVTLHQVSGVVHATTLASNLVLERRGAKVGLLTTAGFEDVLEMRREVRYDSWRLEAAFAPPLVDRAHRRGVRERMLVDGTPHRLVEVSDVEEVARQWLRDGVEAVAVCLLHSYANSEHEDQVAKTLTEVLGAGVPVSLSSVIVPEIREYERTSTTVVNAYIQPSVGEYQGRLESALADRGYHGRMHVMISSGGVATTDVTASHPVRMLESGPVAGVSAAAHYATAMDERAVVAFDLGGTTAKACLVRDGRAERTGGFEVARAERFARGSGLPVQTPSVDLIEIGAGGGSVGWQDSLGLLKVGPRSASSNPGPACYGLGGTEPTVTDANLLLGYLNPDDFAGGSLALDVDAARTALAELGARLSLSAEACAAAMVELVDESMADAIRVHLAERGQPAEETSMLTSGGGGPLHGLSVARKLGIGKVIVPARSGVLSALGLLVTRPSVEFAQTSVVRLDDDTDWARVECLLGQLETQAVDALTGGGTDRTRIEVARSADVRWAGQPHTLTVAVPAGRLGPSTRAGIEATVDAESRRHFGSALSHTVLECLTWRVTATADDVTARIPAPPAATAPSTTAVGTRTVLAPSRRPPSRQVPVYDRASLVQGRRLSGPAIVEDGTSTCVLDDTDVAEVDELGSLVVTFDGGKTRA